MKTFFIDSHAHLDFPDFEGEQDDLVQRAQAAGIQTVITVGTDVESSGQAIALAERFDSVFVVAGWHPCSAVAAPTDLRPALRDFANHTKVVALGETGLDYHHLPSEQEACDASDDDVYRAAQARVFEQHLEIAQETGLNVVIHQRDAYRDTIDLWRPFAEKGVRGVFHCFVGTVAEMEEIISLGGLVSFTGIVTFKNAASVRETVAATPIDRLMLETDCPYLAPVPYRGKRCEPAYVSEIAQCVAEVKGVDLETLAQASNRTAHEFFRGLDQE